MRRLARRTAAFAVLAAIACPALAQTPGLAISGRVEHPLALSQADLQARPSITIEVTHAGHDGPVTATYTGTLLWPLLQAATPIDIPGRNTRLQHTLLARGADGYAVALALAELDPGFASKPVVVAWARDGKALPALQLVVPGDSRAGRSVRELVTVEVF